MPLLYHFGLPTAGFLTGLFLWSLLVSRDHFSGIEARPSRSGLHTTSLPVWRGWSIIKNVFVFGDGMSDTCFDPFGSQPTHDNPFGNTNRSKVEGTSLECTNWISHLQKDHHVPSLLVYNLAHWNGTTEKYAYFAHKNGQSIEYNSITFDEQVVQFQVTYTSSYHWPDIAAPWTGKNSLFIIWFGADDIADNVERKLPLPFDAMFASYMASVEQLYVDGARNFLILNAPPVNRIYVDQLSFIADDITRYNERISWIQRKMLERHSDAEVMIFDVNTLLDRAIDEPGRSSHTQSIKNVTSMCEQREDIDDCKGHFWRSTRLVTDSVMELVAAGVAHDCLKFEQGGLCNNGRQDDRHT